MWVFFLHFDWVITGENFLKGGMPTMNDQHRQRGASHSCAEIRGADKFCGESSGAKHTPEVIHASRSFPGS